MMTIPSARDAWRQIAREDLFVRAYLECALWTSDPDPSPGEWAEHDDWTIDNIDPESIAAVLEDCDAFRESAGNLLDDADPVQAGHDFWLTRNGHGAGFWDRPRDTYPNDPTGRQLTDLSKPYGEANVWPMPDEDGELEPNWDGVITID